MGENMEDEDRECMVCGKKGRARCATHVDLPGGFSTPVAADERGVITEAGGKVVADVHIDLAPLVVRLLNGAGHAFTPTMKAPDLEHLPKPPASSASAARVEEIMGGGWGSIVDGAGPHARVVMGHLAAEVIALRFAADRVKAATKEADALRDVVEHMRAEVDLLRQRLARTQGDLDRERVEHGEVIARIADAIGVKVPG